MTNSFNDPAIIQQTKNWLLQIVIRHQLCPFAGAVLLNNSIHFELIRSLDLAHCLEAFVKECQRMEKEEKTETSLLIYPNLPTDFEDYLDFVAMAEQLLADYDYEGIYQIATFHPNYCFAGVEEDDPANYTNRSLYPMLHILREASVEEALLQFPNPEQIPERNIRWARDQGLEKMKAMREACFQLKD